MQIISLGKVTATAGTPVCIMANLPSSTDQRCHKVVIQSLPDNTGMVYIGSSTINTTTLANVHKILKAAGDSESICGNYGLNVVNPWDLYVDVETSDEGIIGYLFVL
jgi:hypothetical protein